MDGVNESYGVNGSNGVNRSSGVNGSDGVNLSDGVNVSGGVNLSHGVNWSDGVNGSYGVNVSGGVNLSDGVNVSGGVNLSYGVNLSHGVNWSDGVNWSYGVLNSFGVDHEIFCADKRRTFRVFGTEVTEKRFCTVWNELRSRLDDWYPKPHNMFELYKANGESWADTPISEVSNALEVNDPNDPGFDPLPMWKDMPVEAIEYLKSLPEFNAELFKRVTGIDVELESQETNETVLTLNEIAERFGVDVKNLKIKKE